MSQPITLDLPSPDQIATEEIPVIGATLKSTALHLGKYCDDFAKVGLLVFGFQSGLLGPDLVKICSRSVSAANEQTKNFFGLNFFNETKRPKTNLKTFCRSAGVYAVQERRARSEEVPE